MIQFSDSDKIAAFDELAVLFYDRRFGQLSKSEFDLLMFKFIYEKMLRDSTCADGTIDYAKCSDYKISKMLGLTEQRVRNLKVQYHLKYGELDFDWEKAFAKLVENARYDSDARKVVLNIPDPNLYIEIQNYIEETGAYVEKQLNSKILQIRAEYFIALVLKAEPEKSRKQIVDVLKTQFKETSKTDKKFEEKNIGKSLIEGACNVTSIASNISSLISPENIIGKAVLDLISNLG